MQNPLPAVRRWATSHPKMMWLTNGLVTGLLQTTLITLLSLVMWTTPARVVAYIFCGQVNFALNHNTTWSSRHHPDITKLSTVWYRFIALNWSVAFVNAGLQFVFSLLFSLVTWQPEAWILVFGLSFASVLLANIITAGINWYGYDKFVFRNRPFEEN